MSKDQQQTQWPGIGAAVTFTLGALCILAYFVLKPSEGWGPPLLLIYGPIALGITGIVLGIRAGRWQLAALNVIPPLVFPLVMFLGTLAVGP